MRLYKRGGSPFYWYNFTVSGKRYRASTKRTKEADAFRVMAREYEKAMNCTQFGEKPEITLEEAFDRHIRKQQVKSTRSSYDLCKRKILGLGAYAGPEYWSLPRTMHLSEVSDLHLEDHRDERLAEGLKPNSVNLEIKFFKAAYKSCRKKFSCDPDLEFKTLKRFEKSRRLSASEEEDILYILDQKRHRAGFAKAKDLFIYLLDTGVRRGEALDLQWSSINLTEGYIENWNKKSKRETLVPISQRVEEILRRREDQPRPFFEMSNALKVLREAIDHVCNQDEQVNETKGRATIHTLRDTFATRLDEAGVSLLQIKTLLGHSSVKTTEKYATGANREALEAARRVFAS